MPHVDLLSVAEGVVAALPVWGPAVVVLARWLIGKLPAPQQVKLAHARVLVGDVVAAVEQMYAAMPGGNEVKKREAERLATAALAQAGIRLSPEVLNVLIEAAVSALPPSAK